MTKYFRLQTVAIAIFALGFASLAISFAWKELSYRQAAAQRQVIGGCCECGQCSSPQPSPVPSLVPSPVPTPTPPPASPEPENSPTPSSPRPSSRYTRLKTTSLTCERRDFTATMEIRHRDKDVEGVKVKFTYNGESKEATTGSNGEASVHFGYSNDSGVVANPEGEFKSESVEIRAPNDGECAGQGGPSGEVLGATTMAPTGALADGILNAFGNLGGILTVVGTAAYARQRKIQFHK